MPLFSQQRAHLSHAPASAPLPAPAPAGAAASSLLKRYRPLETRAAGGFGTVEICLDSRLQRRVAIKRIPLGTPNSRAAVEAINDAFQEARTMSLLQHPHIVSVIDFTYDAMYGYLVMEYVDGMTLEEFLAAVDGHSLTYDETACIADALVQALDYAHENGTLHLDIKPANVLIDRSGHVKLADFGMAKLTSAAGFGGARGGTLGYMPPEQLRGEAVNRSSDVFSLACVLYESLCGTAPFAAATPIDSMTRINEGVVPPSELLNRMPELSEQALLTALDPDPSCRMKTVGDFGSRFLAQLGSPRKGQASLAHMIEELTADEDGEPAPEDEAEEPGWELDPAEGRLGSRFPRARDIAVMALSGTSVAIVTFSLLQTMGVVDAPARAVAALAVGAAAAAAPQAGSALACTGLLFMIVNATAPLAVLPVAVLLIALASAWWLVWGRTTPTASASLAAFLAAALATRNPLLLAPAVAALSGYALSPVVCAVTVPLGIVLAAWTLAAQAAGGTLGLASAAAALASPGVLVHLAGCTALGAAVSALLRFAWSRDGETVARIARGASYVLPAALSLAMACLAHPMEIASLNAAQLATGAGAAALSSIIVWICVFSLGYRKDPEGDRS